MEEAPYGSWKSAITSDLITGSSRGISDIQLDSCKGNHGSVYWVELRYAEGGRGVICSCVPTQGEKVVEWTPESFSVRTAVHEYGGGPFCVHGGTVYFSNSKGQAVYKQSSPTSEPERLTADGKKWRFADSVFAHSSLYCVMENHEVLEAGAKEAENSIVKINAETGEIVPIAKGANFYASPKISEIGKEIIWMQWNHPNMPWDATEIWLGNLDGNGNILSSRKLLGHDKVNFHEPRWSPDGRIFCICDQTNWWNIYEVDTDSGSLKRNVYPCDIDLGGPHWQFGMQHFSIGTYSGSNYIVYACGKTLCLQHLETGDTKTLETGYTNHRNVWMGKNNDVYCIASSPTHVSSIIKYDLVENKTSILRMSRDDIVDTGYISIPKEIQFPTGESRNEVAYGYFYEPKSKDYCAPQGTLPPLLVKAHGGPTGQTSDALDFKIQYYTSKGYAVLDVNYRGSTGYGRKFRDSLKGPFGVSDVEDCCYGAKYLANERKVDGNKLCITGGSAGGYVVLRAISWPGLFAAAVSKYGISDMEALATDTHKFESVYTFELVAPYPEGAAIYKERSPINFPDKIFCPVAFFQGLDDKVVPPNQTSVMFEAVKAKGLPTALVEFEGEGHGFRKSENIQLSLDGEYYFFCKVLGITPSVTVDGSKMCILNL